MSMNYDELDPGIRDTVRLLREAGYETTDSGDGVTKPADERVFHEPHVIVRLCSIDFELEAEAIAEVLGPDWYVEATYSTLDKVALATCLTRAARERAVQELVAAGVVREAS